MAEVINLTETKTKVQHHLAELEKQSLEIAIPRPVCWSASFQALFSRVTFVTEKINHCFWFQLPYTEAVLETGRREAKHGLSKEQLHRSESGVAFFNFKLRWEYLSADFSPVFACNKDIDNYSPKTLPDFSQWRASGR